MKTAAWWLLGIGFVLAFAGTIGAGGSAASARRAAASTEWPTVVGTVQSAQVVAEHTRPNYQPRIVYAYEVDGLLYSSTNLGTGPAPHGVCRDARAGLPRASCIVDLYPPGSSVVVYYNPRDPYTAMLYPGGEGGQTAFVLGLALLIPGLLLAGVGAALLWRERLARPATSATHPAPPG